MWWLIKSFNKKNKIFVVIFLSVIIFAGSLFVSPFNNRNNDLIVSADNWDTSYAKQAPGTDSDGYYKISNVNELATICYATGTNDVSLQKGSLSLKIRLYTDLNLAGKNWVPVLLTNSSIFDGNNHKISNVTIDGHTYTGFFSKIDYSAQVKNLTLENVTITNGGGYTGAVAGYCEGKKSDTEPNLYNVKVKNSSITALATSTSFSEWYLYGVGGLIGFSYSSLITYSECENVNINVTGTSGGNVCVGGLVGQTRGSKLSVCRYFKSSSEAVNVQSSISGEGFSYVGGIVGYSGTVNGCSTPFIEKCYSAVSNVKNTSSNVTTAYVGGICGYSNPATITNCYSSSAVEARAKETTNEATLSLSNIDGTFSVYNIYNTSLYNHNNGNKKEKTYMEFVIANGSYESSASGLSSAAYTNKKREYTVDSAAGGICGKADNTTISLCYSTNAVSTPSGGNYNNYVIHYKMIKKYSLKENACWDLKLDLTSGKVYNRGRIIGYASNSTVTNCYGENSGLTGSSSISQTVGICNIGFGNEEGDYEGNVAYTINGVNVFKSYNSMIISAGYKVEADGQILLYVDLHDYHVNYREYQIHRQHTGKVGKISTTKTVYYKDATDTTINNIRTASGSAFAVNSAINSGKPFIKDFYWVYSGTQPPVQK